MAVVMAVVMVQAQQLPETQVQPTQEAVAVVQEAVTLEDQAELVEKV